jgi:hypothetical protein
MVHACPTLDNAVNVHLMKLQTLLNTNLQANDNFDRHTPICKMQADLTIPCVFYYITKLCRKQESSKIMHIQIYMQLDKEETFIGSIRGLMYSSFLLHVTWQRFGSVQFNQIESNPIYLISINVTTVTTEQVTYSTSVQSFSNRLRQHK